jgi:hypothetical protein
VPLRILLIVTVHFMTDQSWANTVMEAKHMPPLHSVSVGSKQAPLAILNGHMLLRSQGTCER